MQDHILQVQLFLRDSYEADPFVALTEQYGIKVRKYPEDNLVLLDYDQIESPKTHQIVVECRSLILAMDTLEVVSRKFDRFFNLGEAPELYQDFDFDRAVVLEKADGSLIGVYFNPHTSRWEISTRGMAKAEGEHMFGGTFREKVLAAFGFKSEEHFQQTWNAHLHPNYTHVFEFCSPENRIVTKYDKAHMVLTAIRNKLTGAEHSYSELEDWVVNAEREKFNVRLAERFELESNDFVAEANKLDGLQEGFVIWCEKTGRRVKVKAHTYMVAHKLRGNDAVPTRKNLLALVLEGEVSEWKIYFPEWISLTDACADEVDEFLKEADELFALNNHLGDQKEFAQAIQLSKFKGCSLLFSARKVESIPSKVFNALDIGRKLKFFL